MKNLKKLSRNELKSVAGGKLPGGGSRCFAVYTAPGGTTSNGGMSGHTYTFSGSCSSQSSQANNACVNIISEMGGGRCNYDCECDGVGN